MNCYDCIVEEGETVEAVTAKAGTQLCERHAIERNEADIESSEHMNQMTQRLHDQVSNLGAGLGRTIGRGGGPKRLGDS